MTAKAVAFCYYQREKQLTFLQDPAQQELRQTEVYTLIHIQHGAPALNRRFAQLPALAAIKEDDRTARDESVFFVLLKNISAEGTPSPCAAASARAMCCTQTNNHR